MSNARNIANLPNGDDAPIYACRAWVNFRGTSQSGTLNTSGPVTGLYTATVTGATTFTIEYSSTTYTVTTSGNLEVGDGEGVDLTISGTSVTIDTQIRESGNVSTVVDNGTGDYTVNFETAMLDANYSATFGARRQDDTSDPRNLAAISEKSNATKLSSSLRIINVSASSGGFLSSKAIDFEVINVAIFR